MFFVDDNFRLTRIAGSLAEWFDEEHDALLGEPVTAIVEPDDAGALETALTEVVETRTSRTIACRFDVADEWIPADVELAPVAPEATLGAIVGTVDRNAFRAKRPASRLVQLRNFIELLCDPAVVYDLVEAEPIVKAVNSSFEATFGYGAEYIVGESLNDYIVPSQHRTEARDLDEQIADGNVTTAIVSRETTSGLRKFSYRGLPIARDSGSSYGLAIYADMTEKQRERQHLQVLHRVLRHNLRNKLTIILAMADRITDSCRPDERQEAVSQIVSHAEDLVSVSQKARMAEDILGDTPDDTIVEVGAAATDVIADARETWPDATIEADIETPLPVSTGLEIKDALKNLVENAITHNTASPTVRVATRTDTPIHASTRASGQNAVITVEDDGPGIPDHERAVIFQGADMTQLHHGSGLGLWVVKWIVESSNGTVSYSRSDGRTTITLRLPLATVDDAYASEEASRDSS